MSGGRCNRLTNSFAFFARRPSPILLWAHCWICFASECALSYPCEWNKCFCCRKITLLSYCSLFKSKLGYDDSREPLCLVTRPDSAFSVEWIFSFQQLKKSMNQLEFLLWSTNCALIIHFTKGFCQQRTKLGFRTAISSSQCEHCKKMVLLSLWTGLERMSKNMKQQRRHEQNEA